MNKLKSGFTLIEILIVIAIIGVLSVSLVPNIAGAPAKARDLSKKQAVMQADAAMQAYIVTSGKPVNIAVASSNEQINGDNEGTCLTAIDDEFKSKLFDNELPSATTVEDESVDNCISGGTVYPKFFKDGNTYRFEIQVESGASANHTYAGVAQGEDPEGNVIPAVPARNVFYAGTFTP